METETEYRNLILTNLNEIKQVAASQLLDGRYFYIPTYQRGYRWNKNQVLDLCNDLLEYALKKGKNKDSFYSLQPLIVVKDRKEIDGMERDCFTVIDGQQRLTTIFILYRFLLKGLNIESVQKAKEEFGGLELFHIFYETRPNDFPVLEKLAFTELKGKDIHDIDMAHASNALVYMQQWLDGSVKGQTAETTFKLHEKNESFNKREIREKLLRLLNNKRSTEKEEGNVQFIWYELDSTKDHIKEFLTENKGKIPLTSTEKIKALLLQRRNFGEISSSKDTRETSKQFLDRRQNAMAKDWDNIEMSLHEPDFWAVLSEEKSKENDRIELIFQYIYDIKADKEKYKDAEDYLFRFFYDWLQSLNNEECNDSEIDKDPIDVIWDTVVHTFRMFRNWHYNPLIYNLIGLLIRYKISLVDIAAIYNQKDITQTEDFILKLKKRVSKWVSESIPISNKGNSALGIEEGTDFIDLYYSASQTPIIRHLLIFHNVWPLIQRIESVIEETSEYNNKKKASDAARSPRDINSVLYRFPFDILDSMGWDIEHIDSATTNELRDEEKQSIFLEEASQIPEVSSNPDYILQKRNYDNATEDKKSEFRNELITTIRSILKEDQDETKKNWIGNLTLLDSGTNRSYKNTIYPLKQSEIRKRITKGIFVPISTSNVFEKRFDGCTSDNLYWDFTNKKAYHNCLLKEIKDFLEKYPSVS